MFEDEAAQKIKHTPPGVTTRILTETEVQAYDTALMRAIRKAMESDKATDAVLKEFHHNPRVMAQQIVKLRREVGNDVSPLG